MKEDLASDLGALGPSGRKKKFGIDETRYDNVDPTATEKGRSDRKR